MGGKKNETITSDCFGVLLVCNMSSYSICLAINRLKEKKSKCVSMVLPCVLRNIRNIHISDELISRKLNEEVGEKSHVMQPAVDHVLEFLRPLVQEVNEQSSSSEKVTYEAVLMSKMTCQCSSFFNQNFRQRMLLCTKNVNFVQTTSTLCTKNMVFV